ncbi:type 1 glutamine amidotransferase [Apilactobacillus timberlakei]|uniref:Lipid II isoglutaminyl synthase (glutamine-hydrolyzing) subunit GatD n=1 Tax=Apilactobacillus timberlakei TaxID=2008380 RepID=A0ABY2YST9_9LACO|nr:glutamine amidotransferase [Apilactobacillus timberlakei]TPR12630.1 glutamine amidotransferase [Apilactobacillus timberlakei]TPR13459.1 glutamine amidotransferase [Apilactobacillus timberlakei]TPR15532.1 glutamine amidotransferase [Apilactobacillus timberlakei]TPR17780.1 glutamine amidotransferase [Apilactobacillus timberlakei]TPR18481.1 glutamine amidotransferase [Apilactobacillus timberlakei]
MANKYTLNIAHLYGDLMNTYGDLGNILVLQYYGKKMGIDVQSNVVSLDEDFKANDYDIAVFGGGQDFEQTIVSKDIQTKKDEIKKFIETDGCLLAICGGFQLLGKYYIDANGDKIPGIGVLDHYTEQQHDNRFIGNILIKNEETGEQYHGFENHQGVTYTGKGERPLGDVEKGYGNNGQDKAEGAIYKNVYCTYFHGPILARNNIIAKHILIKALKRRYPNDDFSKLEQMDVEKSY